MIPPRHYLAKRPKTGEQHSTSPVQLPVNKAQNILNEHSKTNKPRTEHVTEPGFAAPPPNHLWRAVKRRAPITDTSSLAEWQTVDDALETCVAPVRLLAEYAPSPEGQAHSDVYWGTTGHVLMNDARFMRAAKGKARAQSGWTAPRWSNVGEFKTRLDAWYGPGEINRGLGSGPKANVSAFPVSAPLRRSPPGISARSGDCGRRRQHVD